MTGDGQIKVQTPDEVAVRNQGQGIAPELLARFFTRFVGDRSTKGLSLGLYLARGIAEAHGDTLIVDSTRDAGTTFRLALPMRNAPR